MISGFTDEKQDFFLVIYYLKTKVHVISNSKLHPYFYQ